MKGLKKCSKIKYFLSVFLVLFLVFSLSVSSFAGSLTKIDNIHIKDMYVTSDSSYTGVTFNNAGTSTIISNSSGSARVPVMYYCPSNWIAGESYQIEFELKNVNFDGFAICFSDNPSVNKGTQLYVVNDGVPSNKKFSYSFVYGGQPYFILVLIFSGNGSVWFGDIGVFSYNPNAEVESKLDEQNSILDEQNSKLFSDGETYSYPEIDLTEQYSMFNEFGDDFLSRGDLIINSNRIVNGVKAFATMFSAVYGSMESDDTLSVFPLLMYLSIIVSIILLIVGFLKTRGVDK